MKTGQRGDDFGAVGASVRCALYTASLSAIRHNPAIRVFYERRVRSGKPKKVVLLAAAHKMLTILNAILRTNTPWKLAHATRQSTQSLDAQSHDAFIPIHHIPIPPALFHPRAALPDLT